MSKKRVRDLKDLKYFCEEKILVLVKKYRIKTILRL